MESLSPNAITRISRMSNSDEDPSFQPTLQVLNIRKVNNSGAQDRYRIVISDGQKFIQGLLATQINHLVDNQSLQQHSIILVQKFVTNVIGGRNLVVLLNVDCIGMMARIGNPVDIASAAAGAENVPPQQQHQQQPQGLYGSQQPQELYGSQGLYGSNKPRNSNNNQSNNSNPYGGGGRRASAAPIARTPGGSAFTPISNLNMYQSRWTIRARITAKSDIKTWSNARGDGSLFSIDLLDASGVDVRATFFKEAVEKFYHSLQEGSVYSFSGGRIKVANMQYNTCKSNFEITFDQNSEIHPQHDATDIQHNVYEFVPSIAEIEHVPANKTIDVLAIVKEIGEATAIMSKKTGKELHKCDLTLVDDSSVEIKMTLWGADKVGSAAQTYANHPVVAFRRARVSDFGGKSLSLSGSACVRPVADVPDQVQRLEQWWSSNGGAATTKSLSASGGKGNTVAPFQERLTISAIKQKHMGHGDKPDWLTFKGTITYIKKDKEGGAWYPACANSGDPCKNMYKVTQTTDGSWYCDKCQGTFPNPVRRWIFSGTVEDDTASTWVSFFNPQAETLFPGNMTADDAYKNFMEHNQDQDGYDSLFYKATQTEWVFKCKLKSEIVNDTERVKASVYALQPLDYVAESEHMLAALEKM
ncbi:Replication protein A 70 kDa DNA-binding subunit [Seminavis robusta]|uniref:Replication protein A subunit n=1 Tax=Seminavis robusta TaxID=568900 RepID=A0A9N8EBW7_9STRA|nr:Replication protein A 70 kDa DNA-binding subunit [Seminavis robusta]|eukprot:Sro944_g222890.1 Replication protein A 70 kDa DNA-binding subunit (643) ;mRNA; f:7129-9333